MRSFEELRARLKNLDGRGYPAYKELRGASAQQGGLTLHFDHIQGDPFAAPSRVRLRLGGDEAGFPAWTTSSPPRRLALEHWLARRLSERCRSLQSRSGSGKSGLLDLDCPGQEVLEQTAVCWREDVLEARMVAGLPAQGRRILGRAAADLLCDRLPELISEALSFDASVEEELRQVVETNEDAEAIRAELAPMNLVAFVGNGSILPRRSGVDQRPMESSQAVAFQSPPGLEVSLSTPNQGVLSGMGIPRGVTLIAGGGFHGKSTLLNALERGVYNHRYGDGREQVVCDPDCVKIRAEDGRSVSSVDISPFISNLPDGSDTGCFSTSNASGSTSQAANIMEAIESGASALLIDEDIAATNFMIRDRRMQELVAPDREPITPFVSKVRALFEGRGISSILVIGGSGDYFEVADTVITLDCYRAREATGEARRIAANHPENAAEQIPGFPRPGGRIPDPRSLDPSKGKRSGSAKARDIGSIEFGREVIALEAVAQLVHPSQTRAVAAALLMARERGLIDGEASVSGILDEIAAADLDRLSSGKRGDLARFRRHELAAALNRVRSLRIRQRGAG